MGELDKVAGIRDYLFNKNKNKQSAWGVPEQGG